MGRYQRDPAVAALPRAHGLRLFELAQPSDRWSDLDSATTRRSVLNVAWPGLPTPARSPATGSSPGLPVGTCARTLNGDRRGLTRPFAPAFEGEADGIGIRHVAVERLADGDLQFGGR